jgi:hypothetical protein
MATKAENFYTDLLTAELADAFTNEFGRAVLRLPNQGRGEVHDDVLVYFSAVAMDQVNTIASKHAIQDQETLHELYQMMRHNLIQGFRIGQNMKGVWKPS